MNKIVRIIIEVEGGIAHTVYSNIEKQKIRVSVLDRDNQKCEEEDQSCFSRLEEEINNLEIVY